MKKAGSIMALVSVTVLLNNKTILGDFQYLYPVVSDFVEVVIGAGRADPPKVLAASINFSQNYDTPYHPVLYSLSTSNFFFIQILIKQFRCKLYKTWQIL